MLAHNFKSAAELGVTDGMYRALQKVLVMLETGELKWTEPRTPAPNGFNMATVNVTKTNEWGEECGTVCCISGWAYRMAGYKRNEEVEGICRADCTQDHLDAWHRLILPDGYIVGKHTVAQAARALRSYLSTGEAEWA